MFFQKSKSFSTETIYHSLKILGVGTLLFSIITSCEVYDLPGPDYGGPMACDPCEAVMRFPTGIVPNGDGDYSAKKDVNGFFHVTPRWDREFLPYFIVEVEATEITDQKNLYNDSQVIWVEFDSNYEWIANSQQDFLTTFYNPFSSDRTQSGVTLPTKTEWKTIERYSGIRLNLVPNYEILINSKPGQGKNKTYRTVGPIPPQAVGDTITLHMWVFWDAGSRSVSKKYSEQFIIDPVN